MASLLWTDGKMYDVPDEKVQQALSDGFKQPTDMDSARAQAAQSPIRAGIEAGVRAAVPIVGPELVSAFGQGLEGTTPEQAMQAQQMRAAENPVASAIGTGAGFVAGPGKVLAGATAPMRAAGLVGRAGAGALEGTAMGLSEAVNESVLGDQPLTAEHMASAAFSAAATGAALDFGFGALSKGTSALIKKAGGKTVSEYMKSKAGDLSLSMIESKKWARKYGVYEDDILKVAREEGVLHRGTSLSQESVAAAKAAEQRIWGDIAGHLESAQYFDPVDGTKITDAVLAPLKKYERDPFAQAALEEVQKTMEGVAEQKPTWRELWKIQGDWRRIADVGGQTVRNDVIDDARRSLREYIMENAGRRLQQAQAGVGPVPRDTTLMKLNKRYAAMSAFEEGLSDATAGYESRGLGFKEQLAGFTAMGGAGGGVPGMAAAGATVVGGKLARKHGGFLLGETLNAMAESDVTKGLADSFRKNVLNRLAVAPELLGPFRATLEAAAARGSMDLLETHTGLAMSNQGPAYLTQMGMSPESPEEMQGMGTRLASLDAVKRASDAQSAALASAADGLFGSAAGRKGTPSSVLSQKEYVNFTESLRKLIKNPEDLYARIPPDMHGVAPNTVGQTAASIVKAAQYLDSKAPKNPYEGMPPSIAPAWQPSAADLDKFNRYKEAVENPAKVLKNLAQGYQSPEQIEALKAVWPSMYADLQQKISERMMMLKKPLTFQQKNALAMVLGPGALAMSPMQVQILQQGQGLAKGQDSGQGKPSKGPDGRQDVNEKQIQTEAQKLEAR